ncbi:MAG: hypothetical protein ACOH1M_01900 [Rhodoglobus sp.]
MAAQSPLDAANIAVVVDSVASTAGVLVAAAVRKCRLMVFPDRDENHRGDVSSESLMESL